MAEPGYNPVGVILTEAILTEAILTALDGNATDMNMIRQYDRAV